MKPFPSIPLVLLPQIALFFGMAKYSEVTGASGWAVAGPLFAIEIAYLVVLTGAVMLFFTKKGAVEASHS